MIVGKIIGSSMSAMALNLTIKDPTGECEVCVLFHSSRRESMGLPEFETLKWAIFLEIHASVHTCWCDFYLGSYWSSFIFRLGYHVVVIGRVIYNYSNACRSKMIVTDVVPTPAVEDVFHTHHLQVMISIERGISTFLLQVRYLFYQSYTTSCCVWYNMLMVSFPASDRDCQRGLHSLLRGLSSNARSVCQNKWNQLRERER